MYSVTHFTHVKVSSYIWISHVAQMNKSRHTYEWVMSQKWRSHTTRMNESCHTYEWVMSHIWMSHVTHMNESCHTYKWVLLHIWMSHVTHMNRVWAMGEGEMPALTNLAESAAARCVSHVWMCHVTYEWETHVCIHDSCTNDEASTTQSLIC